ncbi:thioredoxin [Ferroplasma sp.]|uniref:thioredoxin n=1 Tax=Ferroplasma sp. TaxID=2591003 RepID=UPI00307E24D5
MENNIFGKSSGKNGPVDLNDKNFQSFVSSPKLSIIDMWAAWCAPCRYLSPVVDELSKEYSDKANFGKVNVDENPVTARNYRIESIPTLLFMKNGKVVDTSIGVVPKEFLVQKIKELA